MMCFIVRWQLSSELDREGDRTGFVRRHLGHCAGCQDAHRRLSALHDRLAAAAESAPRAPETLPRRRPVLLVGAAAITAMIAGVVVVRSTSSPATVESPVVATNGPSSPVVSTTNELSRVVDPSRTLTFAASVASWASAEPLRDELVALKSDALRGAAVAFRIAGIR